jgi:hypothetical protein
MSALGELLPLHCRKRNCIRYIVQQLHSYDYCMLNDTSATVYKLMCMHVYMHMYTCNGIYEATTALQHQHCSSMLLLWKTVK